MTNYIEAFKKKTDLSLNRNIDIQDLLSECAMMVDSAQDYTDSTTRFIDRADTADMEKFCKKNLGTLDILLNEQTFIMDCIKDISRHINSYLLDCQKNKWILSDMEVVRQVNIINLQAGEPILGEPREAQTYYDYNAQKGN